ncbi:hypothetical protein [Sulfurisphaera ohwakuensis]|uniref:hypothetical protein n=1 Tax=Sulfurisphaera ohwakuensis TaxID=69656 RepID=UPI0036F21ED0
MSKVYFLFWQAFSLPIAYIVASAYLNINNYIVQLDQLFHMDLSINLPDSIPIAILFFIGALTIPNIYVFLSFESIKEDLVRDLVNEKKEKDLPIETKDNFITIDGHSYTIDDTLDNQLIGFILGSIFPFIINYSSLAILVLYLTIFFFIGTIYVDSSMIVINPYLRIKYQILTLRHEDRRIFIIIEKEKEHERPKFSDYEIRWFYDHLILIGFKKEEKLY